MFGVPDRIPPVKRAAKDAPDCYFVTGRFINPLVHTNKKTAIQAAFVWCTRQDLNLRPTESECFRTDLGVLLITVNNAYMKRFERTVLIEYHPFARFYLVP